MEERRLTALRSSAWQQERLEGQAEKQPLDDDAHAARRLVEMLRHVFLQGGRRVCDLRREIADQASAKVVESLQLLQDLVKILTQPP